MLGPGTRDLGCEHRIPLREGRASAAHPGSREHIALGQRHRGGAAIGACLQRANASGGGWHAPGEVPGKARPAPGREPLEASPGFLLECQRC